jgi:MOSC domain-containing protein YiiM
MNTPHQVLSVNVAQASPLMIDGRRVMTAIGKRPVSTPAQPDRIAVRPLGLEGDDQADPEVHGGLSKAVYAYPHEHLAFWQTVRAQAGQAGWDTPVPPGLMGENLTLTGLFPDCTLAVSEPRQPCYKFQAVMGFNQATKMMAQSGYCGFYLAVIEGGTIAAGESYELIPGPREVSIAELFKVKMRNRD